MKRKAPVALLLATLIAVLFLHIEWAVSENGTLLVVDNQEIDLLGIVNNQWNQFTRSCDSVTRLSSSDEKYKTAQFLIENYSPPNSMSAMIAGAWTVDAWTLVEVEFTDLLPAVVLIQTKEGKSFIVPTAVWSGYTKPWKSAPYIRKYITNDASKVPLALTNCFEPQSLSFQ